jgi:hypothetical protein
MKITKPNPPQFIAIALTLIALASFLYAAFHAAKTDNGKSYYEWPSGKRK